MEIYNGEDDVAEDIKFIRKTYPLLLKEASAEVFRRAGRRQDPNRVCIQRLEKIIAIVDAGMASAKCARSISSMEFMFATPPDCVTAATEEVVNCMV